MPKRSSWFAASLLAALCSSPVEAKLVAHEFPPVTAAEKALTEVPGHANAPAVVLWHRGEIRYSFSFSKGVTAKVAITTRIKVLAEAGKTHGEIELMSYAGQELGDFAARTVTAAGSSIPLRAESVFTNRVSKRKKIDSVRFALSEVDIGSILDTHVEYEVGSFLWLEPWTFQHAVPVLRSEVSFDVPESLVTQEWVRDPQKIGIRTEKTEHRKRVRFRAWVENAPPLHAEAYAPPLGELAARFSVVPVRCSGSACLYGADLYSWSNLGDGVRAFLMATAENERVRAFATELVRDLPREKTEDRVRRLYTFVRDEVKTADDDRGSIVLETDLAEVLSERSGTRSEKALLLEAMLHEVGVDTVWLLGTSSRSGALDEGLPSVGNLDRVLIGATLGDVTVALDPSDRCLAFGQISPELQGTQVLMLPRRTITPRLQSLSTMPASANERRAVIELAIDDDGALRGTGWMYHSGLHAYGACRFQLDEKDPEKRWTEWIEKEFPGFVIEGVITSAPEDRRSWPVRWTMRQREEDHLEGELTLAPSRPLGPVHQILQQPADERLAPVHLAFADREDVELRLAWPAGWVLEQSPQPRDQTSDVGALKVELDAPPDGRSLTYRRKLLISKPRLIGRLPYIALQQLYAETEKSDAQPIVLVRR